ncbi:MAG TPA: NADPH-dependent oxidoreductase [Corynebacterium sp.]|nr:NADPH-dependent oxidoreductase [Corynebacterium sp.]
MHPTDNPTIRTQLDHRTIREFTDQPVDKQTLATLFEVAMRTSTSRGLQNASIIHVTDQELKNRLAEIGNQEYVRRAPVYLLFIVDGRRAAGVLAEAGRPVEPAGSTKVFVEGFTDACLMAQNVTVAAQALGLGTNHLGNIHNDDAAVIDLLGLPKYTFPVLGMTLGHPNQEPQLKPRMSASLRIFENTYREPESWTEALRDYDAEMTTYYDLRKENQREDSFTNQIFTKLAPGGPNDSATPDIARAQGFDV